MEQTNSYYFVCTTCGEITEYHEIPNLQLGEEIYCSKCLAGNMHMAGNQKSLAEKLSAFFRDTRSENRYMLANELRRCGEEILVEAKVQHNSLGKIQIDLNYDHDNTTQYRLRWYSFLEEYLELIQKYGMSIPVDEKSCVDFFGEHHDKSQHIERSRVRELSLERVKRLMKLFEDNGWDR